MRSHRKRLPSKSLLSKESTVNIEISTKSFHLSIPLKELILEKSRHLPPMDSIHIVLTSHKDKLGTEVHVVASHGKEILQTKVQNSNPYTAVISAFKKIRTMANKHYNKRKDKTKHDLGLAAKEELIAIQKEQEDHIGDEWLPFEALDAWDSLKTLGYVPASEKKKISKKKISIRMLSQEEAIRHLEAVQENFLIFLNEHEHKIQCIYKKHDGNYVLIEPSLKPGFRI
ncbi:SigL modulation protein [Chlamydia serpentis]|uniref:Ribosome hibernation promoting factor n=1 Tax=Chlamydia serpentis TaxID=1967782 RepID=A0A2R8FBS1_9CHLA|nr:sigma 54 modulation/S30EA ribosomal C-terminal domain-containing protein [Chlamydia serpentis]SPN73707.1 SigL modulation protein [Chlamydia serpentis]